jgi:PAS domain S-box-containing protein
MSGGLLATGPGAERLLIAPASRSVHVNDVEVSLTPTEYEILLLLAERAGTVVATRDITERVWGEWYGPVDHIFVHIHHLRRKLGPCGHLIVTKRTAGYLLQAQVVDADATSSWLPLSGEYVELLQADAASRGVAWLIVNEHRAVTWVSTSVASLFGWWPDDLVGRRPWDLVYPDDEGQLADGYLLDGAAPDQDVEVRMRRADGSMESVAVVSQELNSSDGQSVGSIGEWRPLPGGEKWTPRKIPPGFSLPFRLRYDEGHRLVNVEPHQAFLGWEPDQVIGTHFSLSGRGNTSSRRLLAAMVASGRMETGFPFLACSRDGMALGVHAVVRMHRREGDVTGFTAEIRLLPT